MKLLLTILVIISGMTIPLQIAANKRLFESLKSPLLTASVTLAGAAVLGAAVMLLVPATRGSIAGATTAPWWGWIGAVCIPFAISVQILSAKQNGAGPIIAFVVAGQLGCALVLDHFGWLEMKREPVRWWNLAGAVLMVAGAAVMQMRGK